MIQKFGGEFVVTGTQGSLGKTGSLKRNYGDVSITQTRNNRAIERLRQHLEEGRQE
jgi:hypothetical protein